MVFFLACAVKMLKYNIASNWEWITWLHIFVVSPWVEPKSRGCAKLLSQTPPPWELCMLGLFLGVTVQRWTGSWLAMVPLLWPMQSAMGRWLLYHLLVYAKGIRIYLNLPVYIDYLIQVLFFRLSPPPFANRTPSTFKMSNYHLAITKFWKLPHTCVITQAPIRLDGVYCFHYVC